MTTPIPHTQYIHNAFERRGLPGAIHALADLYAPSKDIKPQKNLESSRESMVWGMDLQTQIIRESLLNIAKQLENQQ